MTERERATESERERERKSERKSDTEREREKAIDNEWFMILREINITRYFKRQI